MSHPVRLIHTQSNYWSHVEVASTYKTMSPLEKTVLPNSTRSYPIPGNFDSINYVSGFTERLTNRDTHYMIISGIFSKPNV